MYDTRSTYSYVTVFITNRDFTNRFFNETLDIKENQHLSIAVEKKPFSESISNSHKLQEVFIRINCYNSINIICEQKM